MKHYQLKKQFRFRVGAEIVFDLKFKMRVLKHILYFVFLYVSYDNSIVGINGKIDPLSESDDFGEKVIYSQESKYGGILQRF